MLKQEPYRYLYTCVHSNVSHGSHKCPSTDGRNKRCPNNDSALKSKGALIPATTQMNLEDIILIERGQTPEDKGCVIADRRDLESSNPQKQNLEWRWPGAGGDGDLVIHGDGASVWGEENVLEKGGGNSCTAAGTREGHRIPLTMANVVGFMFYILLQQIKTSLQLTF